MRIALATRENLPAWEMDDRPLHAALAARGVEIAHPVWSDPLVPWSSFDACLIRTTWDYQERREAFLAWAGRTAAATRLFNELPVVRWNTHKRYLRDLEARGVPVVPTVWFEAGARVDLPAAMAERRWRRGFIKPAIGSTAWRTMRFGAAGDGARAAQAHLEAVLATGDALLQPYLSSVEGEGELSAIFIDGAITHTVRKIPAPGDYRVQDDFGARDEPVHFTPAELDTARRAMAAAGANLLYGRADFLRDDAGALRLIELELVEPSLFFRHRPGAAERLAAALCARLGG